MAILIPGVGSVEIEGYVPGVGVVFASEGGVTPGPSGTVSGDLVDAIAMASEALFGVSITPTTTMTFSTSVTGQPLWMMLESLSLDDSLSVSFEGIYNLSEMLGINAALLYTAKILAADDFSLTSTSTAEVLRPLILAEILSISAQITATSDVHGSLLEWLALTDLATVASALTAAEAISLAESVTSAITARLNATETLALSDALAGSFIFAGNAADSILFDESLTTTLTAAFLAEEGFAFISRLPLGEDDYQAWVINADNLGVTQYTNYAFNSLVQFAGRSFGVTETGLYELTGDDDEGTAIDAHIKTGQMGFGTLERKRIPRAYLYLQSDDDVYLKTITDEWGQRKERWYKIRQRQESVTLETRRVKLARGVDARTWAIEVSNIDGGTLDIRDMKVLPVILHRRV